MEQGTGRAGSAGGGGLHSGAGRPAGAERPAGARGQAEARGPAESSEPSFNHPGSYPTRSYPGSYPTRSHTSRIARSSPAHLPFLFLFLLLGALIPADSQAQTLSLPPLPSDGFFVQDRAGVLDASTRNELGLIQAEAFRAHQTPIVVVTIQDRAEYGGGGMTVEEFATRWFDHWEIGARDAQGALLNQGILLLISVGDREARIELGADWGRRWDAHAQRIMDDRMVPEFQRGAYGVGAVEGSWALLAMAELGPNATPPRDPSSWLRELQENPVVSNPLPLWGSGILMAMGLLLIGLSFRFPEQQKPLLVAGVILILGALFIWILLLLLAALFGRRSDGSTGGGFRSSGGFGGGGFSGGGGATGRW